MLQLGDKSSAGGLSSTVWPRFGVWPAESHPPSMRLNRRVVFGIRRLVIELGRRRWPCDFLVETTVPPYFPNGFDDAQNRFACRHSDSSREQGGCAGKEKYYRSVRYPLLPRFLLSPCRTTFLRVKPLVPGHSSMKKHLVPGSSSFLPRGSTRLAKLA